MALFSKKPPSDPPAAKAPEPAPQPAQTPASAAPDAAQKAKNAAASQNTLTSLGEIVSLLMRSPAFQNVPLGAVAGLVGPALGLGQFIVARGQTKDGHTAPVGACLWANVSREIDQRLSSDLDKPLQLKPEEWKSGDIPWVVIYVGDKRVLDPMIERLQASTLAGKQLKMRTRGEDGVTRVQTFTPGAKPAPN